MSVTSSVNVPSHSTDSDCVLFWVCSLILLPLPVLSTILLHLSSRGLIVACVDILAEKERIWLMKTNTMAACIENVIHRVRETIDDQESRNQMISYLSGTLVRITCLPMLDDYC